MTHARIGWPADIAPFGQRRSWEAGHDDGMQWDEVREIASLRVTWAEPPAGEPAVQYWRSDWPHKRPPDSGADRGGWHHEGDLYNGTWQTADVEIVREGTVWSFSFGPVNRSEFPELSDFSPTWRATRKLRLHVPGGIPEIRRIEAFTRSRWLRREVVVQWAPGTAPGGGSTDVELYNGHAHDVRSLAAGEGCELSLWTTDARCSTDRTVVTLRGAPHSFSFAVDDLVDGPLFVRDLGALVSLRSDAVSYEEFAAEWEDKHEKTYHERIFDEPEQTLQRAWADMPPKKPFYFPMGLEGRRQRFGVEPDGSIFRGGTGYIHKVPGRDTERLADDADKVTWRFGLPATPPSRRTPLRGYLPMLVTEWETGGLRYTQTAFAALLSEDQSLLDINAPGARADDLVVAVVRFAVTNLGSTETTATLRLTVESDTRESIALGDGGFVANQMGWKRARVGGPEFGAANEDQAVQLSACLAPGKTGEVDLFLPFHDLDEDQKEALCGLDAADLQTAVIDYWERRIDRGARIITPEPMINDFYRAHVAHLLINHERHLEAPVDIARVGSFSYAAFANESVMQLSDMDRRGYHDEAARGYETWVRYQGTVMLSGDFDSVEGCFHGAGGYECASYNQNHGWVLWGMAEHYLLTRDDAWLERVAPAIIVGCDWIIRQRRRTMQLDATGNRPIEYGFLPAGELEDIRDWQYWLSTNVYTWWGLDHAARALERAGHHDAARLKGEAAAMKDDLVAGFTESMVRSPVVRLRDGSAVPHVPAHLHLRGRAFGWLRETLEGAIHLLNGGIFAPDSHIGTWILHDYEDNLYLSENYGYSGCSVPDEEVQWFSRGGFSQQPNLLCGPVPYLARDEIKHFLRAYFNAFASAFHADTRMLTEHPLPRLGDWMGDHFKTSDESQSTRWLRGMFVDEKRGQLLLCHGVPCSWLDDGNEIAVYNLCTWYGSVSMRILSELSEGRITYDVDLPGATPERGSILRMRLPEGYGLRSVSVNGRTWQRSTPDGETVRLPDGERSVRVVAGVVR